MSEVKPKIPDKLLAGYTPESVEHQKTIWAFLAWLERHNMGLPRPGEPSLIREFAGQRDELLREFGVSASGGVRIHPLRPMSSSQPARGSSLDADAEVPLRESPSDLINRFSEATKALKVKPEKATSAVTQESSWIDSGGGRWSTKAKALEEEVSIRAGEVLGYLNRCISPKGEGGKASILMDDLCVEHLWSLVELHRLANDELEEIKKSGGA